MRKLLRLVPLAVCLFGAFPAHAAASRATSILEAGPFTVHSYKMYLLATPSIEGLPAYLTIRFDRGTSNDQEEYFYGFGKGVRVSINSAGTAATLNASLGVFGRIGMSLNTAASGSVPVPCSSASVTGNKGSLRGTFALALHNSVLSGTAYPARLNASIVTANSQVMRACAEAPAVSSGGTQMFVTSQVSPTLLATFTDSRPTHGPGAGSPVEQALLEDSAYLIDDGVTIDDNIQASALPQADLVASPDFSSGSATAGGSFMSGNLSYTASTPATASMPSRGAVSGSLTVHFDGLSPVMFPGGTYTSATLGPAER
jgi:hypothetical protein